MPRLHCPSQFSFGLGLLMLPFHLNISPAIAQTADRENQEVGKMEIWETENSQEVGIKSDGEKQPRPSSRDVQPERLYPQAVIHGHAFHNPHKISHSSASGIKGNGEQATGNSVGFGRGFKQIKTDQNNPPVEVGVSNSQGLGEIKTENGEQRGTSCSPSPVPCSLVNEEQVDSPVHSISPSPTQSLSASTQTAQLPQLPRPQEIQPPTTSPASPLPSPPPPSDLRTPPTAVPSAGSQSDKECPALSNSGQSQPPATVPSNTTEETRVVKRFDVIGSTVFTQQELDQITQPYINRPLTLAEFFQVRDDITQCYQKRGYITSGAFIPPQRLDDGVVKINVVEGRIEDIKVTGTRRLNPGYVRSRIALGTKAPLNQNRLLEALQLLKLNPLIKNVSAELSTGSRPGVSLLTVQVSEAKTLNLQTTLDNGRSPSVGSQRRVVELGEANLLGLGDGLGLGYINTDGSNTEYLTYTVPINPRNGTVSFSYTNSDNHVIERPFNTLDINSSYQSYALTLRQPVIQTPSQEFALSLTASRANSRSNLLGGELPFPLQGANNQGRIRVSALRFTQEYTRRSAKQVISLRSQFSVGLDAFGSTINSQSPDSRFFAWRGQAQLLQLLGRDTLLLVRADLQRSDRALVNLEQFGLGGIDSVRGYRQDRLLGDNGFFTSAELRIPVLRLTQPRGLLQIVPFVDFGTAGNHPGNPTIDPHLLASVGLGLRLQLSDRFSARLDIGIPLVPVRIAGDRTLQERGLYFSINFNPF